MSGTGRYGATFRSTTSVASEVRAPDAAPDRRLQRDIRERRGGQRPDRALDAHPAVARHTRGLRPHRGVRISARGVAV